MERAVTPIPVIEDAGREARRRGHNLAGFRRVSHVGAYHFAARCRGCGLEVAVLDGAGGWWHRSIPPCPRMQPAVTSEP